MNKRDKNGLLNSIDALTDIDDALLSEVFSARRKRGRFARNIIAVAAALLVIVGAILIITNPDDSRQYTVELPTDKPHETALPTEMVTESAEPTQVIYTADPTQVTGTVDPIMTADPTQEAYTADPTQATENALNTPNATSKATNEPTKPTSTPQATERPANTPRITPKATSKPTATPAPQTTDDPISFEVPSEKELASLLRSGRAGSFGRYFAPANVPKGASLRCIRVDGDRVEFVYNVNGGRYVFTWYWGENSQARFDSVCDSEDGYIQDGYFIVDSPNGERAVYWCDYGYMFRAILPNGTELSDVPSLCRAKPVQL